MARAWNGLRNLLALRSNNDPSVQVSDNDHKPAGATAKDILASNKPDLKKPTDGEEHQLPGQRSSVPDKKEAKRSTADVPINFDKAELAVLNPAWQGMVGNLATVESSHSKSCEAASTSSSICHSNYELDKEKKDVVATVKPLSPTNLNSIPKKPVKRALFQGKNDESGKEHNESTAAEQNRRLCQNQCACLEDESKNEAVYEKNLESSSSKVDKAAHKILSSSLSSDDHSPEKKSKQNGNEEALDNDNEIAIAPTASAGNPGARRNIILTSYQEARQKAHAENESILNELLRTVPSYSKDPQLTKPGVLKTAPKRKVSSSKGSPKGKKNKEGS